jgi:hypothetical protein
MNMLQTIVPKSDQLNADDLIARTLTIKVTDVKIKQGDEQPVSIYFEGDNGKPFKLCKSMRRVLVQVWGADASKYIGRSMTIYRDAKVVFAGQAVGGIRISHMSDLEAEITIALTASKAVRKPYTVKPLLVQAPPSSDEISQMIAAYDTCSTRAEFDKLQGDRGNIWDALAKGDKAALKSASDAAAARVGN